MIACLGWGSLVWDPRELPVKKPWREDGPSLKADLLRMSRNGRITFVLDTSAPWVRSLWAVMELDDLRGARIALARREDTYSENNPKHRIDAWSIGELAPTLIEALPERCQEHRVDHVIWTALRSRFHGADRTPTADEVIGYLQGLKGDVSRDAERYIRKAPRQVITPLRQRVAEELGWTPE